MAKTAYVPVRKDWTTYSASEWGSECTFLGGFGIASTGRYEAPIIMVYSLKGGEYIGQIVRLTGKLLEGHLHHPDVDVDPNKTGKLTVAAVSYDPVSVAEADTEEDAVACANEYQGGEADWIADLYKKGTIISDNMECECIFAGDIPDCKPDDHDTAIKFLTEKVHEWAAKQ